MIDGERSKWLLWSAWIRAKRRTKRESKLCRKHTKRARVILSALGAGAAGPLAISQQVCSACRGCVMADEA